MGGENLVDELSRSSNWEVYKDAFAPPLTRRTKPWERAPVSAHAPRLQGQKIWKKPSRNLRLHENKENDDAQAELERGGMGARKKMRGIGEKENISTAKWLLASGENGNEVPEFGVPSPIKKNLATLDADALLVPRKRTNANHLITPRKVGRKLPLAEASIDITQLVAWTETVEDEEAIHAKSQSPTDKPAQRRKSMRKSTRRLTRNEAMDEAVAAPVQEVELKVHNDAFNDSSVPKTTPKVVFSHPVDIFGTLSQQSLAAPVGDGGEARVQVIDLEELHSTLESGSTKHGTLKVEELSSTSVDEPSYATELDILPTLHEEISMEDQDRPALVITGIMDENFQAALVELAPTAESLVPTKTSETPKKKRMSSRNSRTPQRSATWRGTRATRSTSIIADSQSDPKGGVINQTSSELPDKASSTYKLQATPRPRISNITPPLTTETMHDAQDFATAFDMPEDIITKVDEPQLTLQLSALRPNDGQVELPISGSNEMDIIQEALILEAGDESLVRASSQELCQVSNGGILDFDQCGDIGDDVTEAQHVSDSDLDSHQPQLPEHDPEIITTSPPADHADLKSDDPSEISENFEELEPISLQMENILETSSDEATEDLPETSTPDPSTTELVETISQNAPATSIEEDDTDLLRNFLSRVKANKAAKASTSIPKRKRSLPHSPIQLPLGTAPTTSSPTSPKTNHNDEMDELNQDEFDVSAPATSPSKRRKLGQHAHEHTEAEGSQSRATRRDGLRPSRLPSRIQKQAAAPSFIPLRRLNGKAGENTVTLPRNEEKELATLTKLNTRLNKGTATLPSRVLSKQGEEKEKEDPASKHKALKEAFDEKESAAKKGKNKKRKMVVWAKELATFQTESKSENEPGSILPSVAIATIEEMKTAPKEGKKKAVKVGGSMRSKMSLGMAANGTPAPKRKVRERKAT